MSDEAVKRRCRTIRLIIAAWPKKKASEYISSGEHLIKNYPPGSLGFERGKLCLALADLFIEFVRTIGK